MNRMLLAGCLTAASLAFADTSKEAPAAPGMDWSKVGPSSRKPTNEKATRKEIDEYFKKVEADSANMTAYVDFPVFMVTDDAKGAIEAKPTSKEEYVAMMKPFIENMPKDAKTTHKPQIAVLSDALVSVTDEFTTTMGKVKMAGRNHCLLVKVDGQWKMKSMTEAGWGGMMTPAMAATPAPAAKPVAVAPVAPAAAPAPAAPAAAPAKK